MNTKDMEVFALVADTGSFTKAAQRMGVSKSVISRRVNDLEIELGVHLLNRTTRGMTLTELGSRFHGRCRLILGQIDETMEMITGAVPQIAGVLRISAPVTFGLMHLMPAFQDLLDTFPKLELDVTFSDRLVDLVGEGFDMAVRIGNLADSSLIARRIAPVTHIVLASDEYLRRRGRPLTPGELLNHECIIYTGASIRDQWRFRVGDEWISIPIKGRFRTNNAEAMCAAAVRGLGLVSIPTFVTGPMIKSGQLKRILADYEIQQSGLHVVFPPHGGKAARAQVITNYLAKKFGPRPYWELEHDTTQPIVADKETLGALDVR